MCCMNLSLKYNNESSYRKDTEIYEYMLSFYPITTITTRDFRTFEMDVCSIVEWNFTKPTVYTFLQYFINLPTTNTYATPTSTGTKGQNYDESSSTNVYLIKTNFNNIIYCISEYAILIKSLSHISPSLIAAACYLMTCEIYHHNSYTTPIITPTSTTYTSACPVYNCKCMYVYAVLSCYTFTVTIRTSYNNTHTYSVYSVILFY